MARHLAYEAFITEDDLTCDCDDLLDLSDVIDAASDLVSRLSAGQFRGRTTTTFRPVYEGCGIGGLCGDVDALPLPFVQPVVTQVKIDGAVVSADEYKLLDGDKLIRLSTDGDRPPAWPSTNKLWLADTQERTWSLTVTHGHFVDLTVKRATAEAACEILDGYGKKQQLDGHVTSATLDLLTISRDPEVAEEAGFSWLARFLRLWGTIRGAEVWSPDLNRGWTFHTLA